MKRPSPSREGSMNTPPEDTRSGSDATSSAGSDADRPGGTDVGFDAVVAEIEAETERRRASGEYPPELLERLDAEFDRFAPLSFRRTGIDGAIRAVESAAFVNVDAPVESTRRTARTVKTAVKRSTAWYHLHLARQVTALGIQITRPLRMLNERTEDLDARVAALEAALGHQDEATAAHVRELASPPPSEELTAAVAAAIGGHPGRVAHIGAAHDDLVAALVEAGVDAYGVDPHGGGGLDLEIRAEEPLDHLRTLATGALGGIVLTGVTDTMPSGARVELCRLAVDRVASGGRVVVVSHEPATWSDIAGPVVDDLASGRPWHTDTWLHLLRRHGGRAPHLDAVIAGQRIVIASAS